MYTPCLAQCTWKWYVCINEVFFKFGLILSDLYKEKVAAVVKTMGCFPL